MLVLVLPARREGIPGQGPEQGAYGAAGSGPAAAASIVRRLELRGEPASPDLRRLASWVVETADNGASPFAVIDKLAARVYLFEPGGRLIAASPVLLGYARGDHTVEGIGDRPIAEVRPFERTTPAGRFVAQPGRNAGDEQVLWVDYDAAVSMHRLRATDPVERRAERLASPTPLDNRISYGCINLPATFFETSFWPRFGKAESVVYVLPEIQPLARIFPALASYTPKPSSDF